MMDSIIWYMTMFYKYREYPIQSINTFYKRSELQTLYHNILLHLHSFFYVFGHQNQKQRAAQSKKTYGGSDFHNPIRSKQQNDETMQMIRQIDTDNESLNSINEEKVIKKKKMKYKHRSTLEGRALFSKDKNSLLRCLKNLNKEIIYTVLIKEIYEEKNVKVAVVTENFLSVSMSNFADRNLPASSTTIEPKDEEQSNSKMSKYFLPETNDEIKFYFLKYCSELPIDSSPLPTQPKFTDEMIDSILEHLWNVELKPSREYLEEFYLSNPSFYDYLQADQNVLIITWLQLILLPENFTVVYPLIEELVKSTHNLDNRFIDKMNAYLHCFTLLSTKKLFAQLLSKYNFLYMAIDFLSGSKELVNYQLKEEKGLLLMEDSTMNIQFYNKEALEQMLKDWAEIVGTVSDAHCNNPKLFWARLLEDCLELKNREALQRVSLSYSLLQLHSRISDGSVKEKIENIIIGEIIKPINEGGSDAVSRKSLKNISPSKSEFPTQKNITKQHDVWESQMIEELNLFQYLNELLDLGSEIFQQQFDALAEWFSVVHLDLKEIMKENSISNDKITLLMREYKKKIRGVEEMLFEEEEGIGHMAMVQLKLHQGIYIQVCEMLAKENILEVKPPLLTQKKIKNIVEKGEVEGSSCSYDSIELSIIERVNQHIKLVNLININSYIYSSKSKKKPVENYLSTYELSLQISVELEKDSHSHGSRGSILRREKGLSLVGGNKRKMSVERVEDTNQKLDECIATHNETLVSMYRCIEICKYFFEKYSENSLCETCSNGNQAILEKMNQFMQMYKVKKDQSIQMENFGAEILQHREELEKNISSYRIKTKMLYINIFISSLHVSTPIYQNIQNQKTLQQEKSAKIRIIGKDYFVTLHKLMNQDKCLDTTPHDQEETEYQIIFLYLITSLIDFLFEMNDETANLNKYRSLMVNFFSTKIHGLIRNGNSNLNEEFVNFQKLMKQIFQLNSSVGSNAEINEEIFLGKLAEIRYNETDDEVIFKLKNHLQQRKKILDGCGTIQDKLSYLDKKLFYSMLRQIYFYLYYDIGFFEEKPEQARRNYFLYEQKIISFFDEITKKDKSEFFFKKQAELKQRSIHLKGYHLKYEKQPLNIEENKLYLMRIICVFDKILHLLTESKQKQMKKKRGQIRLERHHIKEEPLYIPYISTQFRKPNYQIVKTFTIELYYFYEAIKIYQNIRKANTSDSCRRFSNFAEKPFDFKKLIKSQITDQQMFFLQQNKESLLSLWKNEELQVVHQIKVDLIRKNFMSKVEKLYIDLDVRHKVFESFKNKILGYQMQKTKIYHQYMDYIRGLKLDVYAHIGGEDPLPYFKIINAIKLYRLKIRKSELEKKINRQFGKNLNKWNTGIMQDLMKYQNWIKSQVIFWEKKDEQEVKKKKELYQIYDAIQKELKRQLSKTKRKSSVKLAAVCTNIMKRSNSASRVQIRKIPKFNYKK